MNTENQIEELVDVLHKNSTIIKSYVTGVKVYGISEMNKELREAIRLEITNTAVKNSIKTHYLATEESRERTFSRRDYILHGAGLPAGNCDILGVSNLRKYSCQERNNYLANTLEQSPKFDFLILDGIVDFVTNTQDYEQKFNLTYLIKKSRNPNLIVAAFFYTNGDLPLL